MSALAKVLKDMGYFVTGSDCEEVFFTDNILKENNISYKVFNKKNINNEYTYIISSCYQDDHEEVLEIKKNNYKYYYYHQFIEKFFKNKLGVAGVHGKTTTTSFVKDLFSNKKISALIGDGTGIGNQDYDYFIFEACEYKNHILSYNFDYLIITNIDNDHLDFFKDINEIFETFKKACEKAKYIIINENIKIEHPNKYTFGKEKDSYCYYEIIEQNEKGYKLKIIIDKNEHYINYPYYGIHMIEDLLASITLYYLVNKELDSLQEKIYNFKKINRRMNEYYYKGNIIIDDYAHHPTEIKALLQAVKQKYYDKSINVIFQPHTYSRTLNLRKEFNECFELCDKLFLMNTFTSKREKYSKKLEEETYNIFKNKQEFNERTLKDLFSGEGKIIIFLGAGNFNKYINKIRS